MDLIADEFRKDYELLKTGFALLPAQGLRLIELMGEDRVDWLQGQATNDLRGMQPREMRSFCLCQPTGQIEAVCDAWAEPDRLWIATDERGAAAVLKRAETMVILEDVSAQLTDFACRTWAGEVFIRSGLTLPSWRVARRTDDLWAPPGSEEHLYEKMPQVGEAAYEIARLEAGIPKPWVDYSPKTLPPELGPAFEAKHVSYQKGCYTGQEVLMRIHSRGHTNKTWVALLLDGPVSAGDTVAHASRSDAGLVTSVALSPDFGWIAGATLRNEATKEGERVQVGGAQGEVRAMPLRSGGGG